MELVFRKLFCIIINIKSIMNLNLTTKLNICVWLLINIMIHQKQLTISIYIRWEANTISWYISVTYLELKNTC